MIYEIKKLDLKEGDIVLVRLSRKNNNEYTINEIGSIVHKLTRKLGINVPVLVIPYGIKISKLDRDRKQRIKKILEWSLKKEEE